MKFEVVLQVTLPEGASEEEAKEWAAALLDQASPKCRVCHGGGSLKASPLRPKECPACGGSGKEGKHPYDPKILGVRSAG